MNRHDLAERCSALRPFTRWVAGGGTKNYRNTVFCVFGGSKRAAKSSNYQRNNQLGDENPSPILVSPASPSPLPPSPVPRPGGCGGMDWIMETGRPGQQGLRKLARLDLACPNYGAAEDLTLSANQLV